MSCPVIERVGTAVGDIDGAGVGDVDGAGVGDAVVDVVACVGTAEGDVVGT